MSFWTQLTFFARPTDGALDGPHRSGAIAMRILGWTLVATQTISLALLPFTLPAIIQASEGTPGAAVFAVVGVIFGFIFGIGLMVLWLWWLGWSSERWLDQDPRGLTHARIIAIIQIVFAAYGILAIFVFASWASALGVLAYPPWLEFWQYANPSPYIILGTCIAILVFGKKTQDQGVF